MILAVLSLTFLEGKSEDGLAAINESLVRTRSFDGCIDVKITQDVSDPHRIMIVEQWESLEQDRAYRAFAAANPSDAMKRLGGFIAGPPVKFIGAHRADV